MPSPISTSDTLIVTLPETLLSWPWKRHLNPHYGSCKVESSKWLESLNAFSPDAQRAFDKGNFGLLAALVYPLLDKDGCRLGCDLMNLLFLFDEHTDAGNAEMVRAQVDIVMDSIYNSSTPRPQNEWIGGKGTQQFWLNMIKCATSLCQHRFINTLQTYLDAVVQQAADRSINHVRDIDSYFAIRRASSGIRPTFAICELYLNIPNSVMAHPVIEKLTELAVDMIFIDNDTVSYKVERERGDDGHNLVTVVMNQLRVGPQMAFDYISDLYSRKEAQFLEAWKNIPTYEGPLDLYVRTYCYGLGNWVRGNNSWNFETERYLGEKGLEIQTTRKVEIKDYTDITALKEI